MEYDADIILTSIASAIPQPIHVLPPWLTGNSPMRSLRSACESIGSRLLIVWADDENCTIPTSDPLCTVFRKYAAALFVTSILVCKSYVLIFIANWNTEFHMAHDGIAGLPVESKSIFIHRYIGPSTSSRQIINSVSLRLTSGESSTMIYCMHKGSRCPRYIWAYIWSIRDRQK